MECVLGATFPQKLQLAKYQITDLLSLWKVHHDLFQPFLEEEFPCSEESQGLCERLLLLITFQDRWLRARVGS